MHEPAVTLTDYALTVEAWLFAWLLLRRSGDGLRRWFVIFFVAVGTASLTGGTVHGFFPDATSLGSVVLWRATMMAVGSAALAAWIIALEIQFSLRVVRAALPVLGLAFLAYCFVVFFVSEDFLIAILSYLPGALFLLVVLAVAYRRFREFELLIGVFGLLLTFVAAGIQQGEVVIHPVYFDHNALYHVVQAVGLYFLYRSAAWLVENR